MSKELKKALKGFMKEHDVTAEEIGAALGLGEAAEEADEGKSDKKGKKEKGGKKGKGDNANATLLADLSDEEIVEIAIELEVSNKKKAEKAGRDALIELILAHEDQNEVAEVIEDLTVDAKGKDKGGKKDKKKSKDKDESSDEEDEGKSKKDKKGKKGKKEKPDYDDMGIEDLVSEVVKRELATEKKAKKMSSDDLIEMLEENDKE